MLLTAPAPLGILRSSNEVNAMTRIAKYLNSPEAEAAAMNIGLVGCFVVMALAFFGAI